MKRCLVTLVFILLISNFGFSQGVASISRSYSFSTTGTQPSSPGLDIRSLNLGFLKAQWDLNGSGPATTSACAFKVEGSTDGVTWASTIITSQTCTSDGQTAIIAVGTASSFIRVNVTSFTASFGSPLLTVNLSGWNEVAGASITNPLYSINISDSGGTAYTGTGSTVATLSATSGTVVTANTIYVSQISFYNTTSGAITINRTDTAGNQLEVAFSIPANSNYIRSYALPEKMVGLKMWASATNSINYTISATQ